MFNLVTKNSLNKWNQCNFIYTSLYSLSFSTDSNSTSITNTSRSLNRSIKINSENYKQYNFQVKVFELLEVHFPSFCSDDAFKSDLFGRIFTILPTEISNLLNPLFNKQEISSFNKYILSQRKCLLNDTCSSKIEEIINSFTQNNSIIFNNFGILNDTNFIKFVNNYLDFILKNKINNNIIDLINSNDLNLNNINYDDDNSSNFDIKNYNFVYYHNLFDKGICPNCLLQNNLKFFNNLLLKFKKELVQVHFLRNNLNYDYNLSAKYIILDDLSHFSLNYNLIFNNKSLNIIFNDLLLKETELNPINDKFNQIILNFLNVFDKFVIFLCNNNSKFLDITEFLFIVYKIQTINIVFNYILNDKELSFLNWLKNQLINKYYKVTNIYIYNNYLNNYYTSVVNFDKDISFVEKDKFIIFVKEFFKLCSGITNNSYFSKPLDESLLDYTIKSNNNFNLNITKNNILFLDKFNVQPKIIKRNIHVYSKVPLSRNIDNGTLEEFNVQQPKIIKRYIHVHSKAPPNLFDDKISSKNLNAFNEFKINNTNTLKKVKQVIADDIKKRAKESKVIKNNLDYTAKVLYKDLKVLPDAVDILNNNTNLGKSLNMKNNLTIKTKLLPKDTPSSSISIKNISYPTDLKKKIIENRSFLNSNSFIKENVKIESPIINEPLITILSDNKASNINSNLVENNVLNSTIGNNVVINIFSELFDIYKYNIFKYIWFFLKIIASTIYNNVNYYFDYIRMCLFRRYLFLLSLPYLSYINNIINFFNKLYLDFVNVLIALGEISIYVQYFFISSFILFFIMSFKYILTFFYKLYKYLFCYEKLAKDNAEVILKNTEVVENIYNNEKLKKKKFKFNFSPPFIHKNSFHSSSITLFPKNPRINIPKNNQNNHMFNYPSGINVSVKSLISKFTTPNIKPSQISLTTVKPSTTILPPIKNMINDSVGNAFSAAGPPIKNMINDSVGNAFATAESVLTKKLQDGSTYVITTGKYALSSAMKHSIDNNVTKLVMSYSISRGSHFFVKKFISYGIGCFGFFNIPPEVIEYAISLTSIKLNTAVFIPKVKDLIDGYMGTTPPTNLLEGLEGRGSPVGSPVGSPATSPFTDPVIPNVTTPGIPPIVVTPIIQMDPSNTINTFVNEAIISGGFAGQIPPGIQNQISNSIGNNIGVTNTGEVLINNTNIINDLNKILPNLTPEQKIAVEEAANNVEKKLLETINNNNNTGEDVSFAIFCTFIIMVMSFISFLFLKLIGSDMVLNNSTIISLLVPIIVEFFWNKFESHHELTYQEWGFKLFMSGVITKFTLYLVKRLKDRCNESDSIESESDND